MARVSGVDPVPVAMSSSSHPTCGEEWAVDNLAAARDEAATSFLLLRLQWRFTNGSLKQIRRRRDLRRRGRPVKEMAGVKASSCGGLQLWSPPAAPHNQSSK
ncbi:uncharacterized protein [Aegilops tauschii subsp. strangulata]|uniref:uncharacterized protein n=1 Tax=Aegilops tauschii subsp. strangulata TaxID=200361 RepID=UPI003CC871DF